MAINKVVYGNNTLIDLSQDTVTESDVVSGKTFHLPSGVRATGNAVIGDGSLIINEDGTTVETFTANQTGNTTLDLGNLAFYNAETVGSGVDTVKVGISMDLLWTNNDSLSSFGERTISLDLSDYSMIVVQTRSYGGSTNAISVTIKNVLTSNQNNYGGKQTFRNFTATDSGVNFTTGHVVNTYGSSATTDATKNIPIAIYGIR